MVRPELLIRKNEEQNIIEWEPKIKKAAVLMQEDIGEWFAIMNEAIEEHIEMFKLLKVGEQLRGGRRNIKLSSQTDSIDG